MSNLDILFTAASGKAGDVVAARNRGGLYFRSFTAPDNTSTPARLRARNAMTQASSRWLNGTTEAQRAGWETYAKNVPLPNALGDHRAVQGRNMFLRSNIISRLLPGPDMLDAPTLFRQAIFSLVTFTQGPPGNRLVISFDPTDEWASAAPGGMVIQASTGQKKTINFFATPFRFAGSIRASAMPITSPKNIVSPFMYAPGQRIFIRVRVMTPDGRVSNSQIQQHDIP